MENPSSGRQVFPRGTTDGQTNKWTDITNQTVAILSFVNAPKRTEKKTKRC